MVGSKGDLTDRILLGLGGKNHSTFSNLSGLYSLRLASAIRVPRPFPHGVMATLLPLEQSFLVRVQVGKLGNGQLATRYLSARGEVDHAGN